MMVGCVREIGTHCATSGPTGGLLPVTLQDRPSLDREEGHPDHNLTRPYHAPYHGAGRGWGQVPWEVAWAGPEGWASLRPKQENMTIR